MKSGRIGTRHFLRRKNTTPPSLVTAMPSIESEKEGRWLEKTSGVRRWVLGLMLAGIAGGIFVWPHAARRYHRWNSQRHLQSASAFFAKGDYRHAMVSAQGALQHNFADPDATRIMAKSLEILRAPGAAEWRERLAVLSPGDAENILARARAALKTNGVESAVQMLDGLSPEERNSAAYHDVAAAIAMGKKDPASAEAHWAEAARLEPADDRHQLNLAHLRLESRNPDARAAAVAALQELRKQPPASLEALRLLLTDALSTGNMERVGEMADALVADARSTFADKLTRLTALRRVQDARSGPYLLELRDAAVADPANLSSLMIWMNSKDLSLMVTEWVSALPQESMAPPAVRFAVAEAYSRVGEWTKLMEFTKSSTWADMDYMRRAFLSRAHDRLDEEDGSAREWTLAVSAARARSDAVERLIKIALAWKWDKRAEELMWILSTRPECPRWVAVSLWKSASQRGETARLHKLSHVLVKLDPQSVATRNNYAFLSLLTRNDEGDPHRIAASLHREYPDNVEVTTTYGLSLHQQGRAIEAVAQMSALKPEALRQPQVALYYAIFLIAAGQQEKAEEFLKLSEGSPMLPEEKAMIGRVKVANAEAQELLRKGTAPAARDGKSQ